MFSFLLFRALVPDSLLQIRMPGEHALAVSAELSHQRQHQGIQRKHEALLEKGSHRLYRAVAGVVAYLG